MRGWHVDRQLELVDQKIFNALLPFQGTAFWVLRFRALGFRVSGVGFWGVGLGLPSVCFPRVCDAPRPGD